MGFSSMLSATDCLRGKLCIKNSTGFEPYTLLALTTALCASKAEIEAVKFELYGRF